MGWDGWDGMGWLYRTLRLLRAPYGSNNVARTHQMILHVVRHNFARTPEIVFHALTPKMVACTPKWCCMHS